MDYNLKKQQNQKQHHIQQQDAYQRNHILNKYFQINFIVLTHLIFK